MNTAAQPYIPYDDGDWDAHCKAQQAREAEDRALPQPYADQAEAHAMFAEDFGLDPHEPKPSA